MIAVKRLQSVLWVLLVTFGALAAYLVSLRVGTERNELARVRTEIASTRSDIRYLQTEFSARSSLRQLEKWNAEDLLYTTPTAAQYLAGERALAHLDGIEPNGPAYKAPPVMAAMVETPADLPSAKPAAPASPAATQIAEDTSLIRTAQAADKVAKLPVPKPAKTKDGKSSEDVRKSQRMAMLEEKLLDDGYWNEIRTRIARDKKGEKR
jgi:hypothetical protein